MDTSKISEQVKHPSIFQIAVAAAIATLFLVMFSVIRDGRQDQAELKVQLKESQDRNDLLNLRLEQVASNAAEQLKALEELKKQKPTVQQIVREIPKYIPLTGPVKEVPATDDKGVQIPNAPSAGLQLNPQQAQELRQFALQCKQTEVELSACSESYKIQGEKLAIAEKDRDTAVKVAKGGSFWKRFKRAGKYIAIGAAIGAAGTAIAH
jgi:hypothetical protein